MGIEFFSRIARVAALSFAYAAFGMLLFAIAIWLITKSAPFSVRKEIADDQNLAVGIVLGSVLIGVALIVSAVIRG